MDQNSRFDVRTVSGCRVDNKEQLLRLLAETASEMNPPRKAKLTADYIFKKVLERESEHPTEVDQGIFFPHARFSELDELSVVFALPPAETDSEIRFVCLLLIPENHPMQALKLMSHLANLLRTGDGRKHLFALVGDGDPAKLAAVLKPDEREILCARDLLIPCRCPLTPEMPLAEATTLMLERHVELAPVLDKEGRLAGEISCSILFKLGIPDFFGQLKSVGFIRYFDPFENYFAIEAKSSVADVMTRNVPTFRGDITLIEIVFAMTVEKIPLLYITDPKGRLLGVIDQAVLLERVINL